MALSRTRMLDRMMANDASFDRKFIVGVKTTGIYCVASCRAPKPKPENVDFYGSPKEAAGAGFRACKRCQPDQSFAGIDPDEIRFEELIRGVRKDPSQFEGVEAMAKAAGASVSKLHSGLRHYYQATPLELLTEAKVAKAATLLRETDTAISALEAEVGYASTSAFYEQFGRLMGMPPAAYRALRDSSEFEILLPQPYPVEMLLAYLGRDEADPTIQRKGDHFRMVMGETRLAQLEFSVAGDRLTVRVERGLGAKAHGLLRRMIGLNQDPRPLDAILALAPRFAILTGDVGLRVFQTPALFDAIAWSILGQQLTVRFAMTLRQRLFDLLEIQSLDGLYRPLQPEDVVKLTIDQLLPLQFSSRKAEYLIGIGQRFVSEGLQPEELRSWSATRLQRWFLETRGFGPWSTNYAMMRGCGFANCIPLGDTGLTSGLQRLYRLEERPGNEETLELMKPFEPYRSLATFRIWFSRRLWEKEEVVVA